MRHLLLAFALSHLALPALRADEVTLKDGTVHKDLSLVKETEKMLEFVTLDGKKLQFNKDSVAKHERLPTARDEYKTRKAAVKPKDAGGLFDLANWAKEKGLARDARQDYEAVLKADPEHAGAHEALGHKQLNGKWLSEAEYRKAAASAMEAEAKARGWKKLKDTWVSPVEFARHEKGLLKHTDPKLGDFWVAKDIKKKIDEEGWGWAAGEWVSPKDKEKLDAGNRMYKGRWMSIDDLDAQHSTLDDPWVLKDKHVELHTNAPHQKAVRLLAIAEDCYAGLVEIFGDVHPDLYDERGLLLVVVANSLNDYKFLGAKFGQPDDVAEHSGSFGAFFAPEYRAKDAKGKEADRPAGLVFMGPDDSIARIHVGHALAHAYLDRIVPQVDGDSKLVEAMAGYIAATHLGKFAPNLWLCRYICAADRVWNPVPRTLEDVTYKKPQERAEQSLWQAGVVLHFLEQKNPAAFRAFWRSYGSKDTGTRKPAAGAVSTTASIRGLLEACAGKDGKVDEAAVNAEFVAFLDKFRKTYPPWDR